MCRAWTRLGTTALKFALLLGVAIVAASARLQDKIKTCGTIHIDTQTTKCCVLGAGFYTEDQKACRAACKRTRDCAAFEYSLLQDTCTLRSKPAKLGIEGATSYFYSGTCTVSPSPSPPGNDYACLGGKDRRTGETHRACVPTAGTSTSQQCSRDCAPLPPPPTARCQEYKTQAACINSTDYKERCNWSNDHCVDTSCQDVKLQSDCENAFFKPLCTWADGKCGKTPPSTASCPAFKTEAQCEGARSSDARPSHRCTWANGACSITPRIVPLKNFTCEQQYLPGWLQAQECFIAMFLLKDVVNTSGSRSYCCDGDVLSDFSTRPQDALDLANAVGHGSTFSLDSQGEDSKIHVGTDCPRWIQWVNYLLIHNISDKARGMVQNGTVPTQHCGWPIASI